MFQSPDNQRGPHVEKQRVLVVDDEPTLRLGFAYALTSKNTVVETAVNGRHALEKIAMGRFDVIILDLRMPELDGLGVIDALRKNGNQLPVVLCSAAIHSTAALRAIRHGVVDFLLKPVRPTELREVVEFVLRPERRGYPLAMKAARSGNVQEAIRLLEAEGGSNPRMTFWLQVLVAMRDEDDAVGDMLGSGLQVLAFNTPPIS